MSKSELDENKEYLLFAMNVWVEIIRCIPAELGGLAIEIFLSLSGQRPSEYQIGYVLRQFENKQTTPNNPAQQFAMGRWEREKHRSLVKDAWNMTTLSISLIAESIFLKK